MLTIYRDADCDGIIVPEETAGDARSAAAEILCKSGIPDEDNVEDTGLAVDYADLTEAQAYHLGRHGWCPEEEDEDLLEWYGTASD